jgi:hypothetical protein
VTFDGYYRNKNQKTKQGFFFNWNTYTTGQAFCFLKCPESIGGKNIYWVRWPSDWGQVSSHSNNLFTRVALIEGEK